MGGAEFVVGGVGCWAWREGRVEGAVEGEEEGDGGEGGRGEWKWEGVSILLMAFGVWVAGMGGNRLGFWRSECVFVCEYKIYPYNI